MTEIERISYRVKRNGEFLDATQHLIDEFIIWRLETDLTHIELDGLRFKVQTLGYKDWLIWRLQNELNESVTNDETPIDVDYEEFATVS